MADVFETAHCLIALGGDINNTVPKRHVTAGEIAVLQMIHGKDAVFDIEPSGTVSRSNRVEKVRLTEMYGKARGSNGDVLIDKLYPGAAARIFQRLDELDLTTAQFLPGLAPDGLDERDAAVSKAVAEGKLLADGSLDDDGLDDLPADDEPVDAEPPATGALV